MHHPSARRVLRASFAAAFLLLLLIPLSIWSLPVQGTSDAVAAVTLQPIANSHIFIQPVFATHASDGSRRLFVVEKGGRIKIIQNGQVLPTPFLDISSRVENNHENGLLSVAFPPNYVQAGYFFVYYNSNDKDIAAAEPDDQNNASGWDIVVARYRVSATDPNLADPNSGEIILTRNKPYDTHNGGMMAFGPDGYLYLGLGDGGAAGDLLRQAQKKTTILGKMLRIAVGGTGTYTIPPTNPFAGVAGVKQEIWDIGVRNPWRWSFDRLTGDMIIADVGQASWEEVNVHPAGVSGGLNFGWSCYEGTSQFNWNRGGNDCSVQFTMPHLVYPRSDGFSITGGYVYRGAAYPSLRGKYFFADYVSGRIWTIERSGSTWTTNKQLVLDTGYSIVSFGEDQAGELYVVDMNGGIYQVTSNDLPPLTATSTATSTPIPTATNTAVPTPLPGTPTFTPTSTPTNTPLPTSTPTATATNLPTTNTPTATFVADADFKLPGTQPGHLVDSIVNPATCGNCHTEPIYDAWRGSMMSQAGRDPLFWAALRVAEDDVPGSGDYCLRCHSPKGWFEGRSHPFDGSALTPTDISAGIACEVCHRAVSPGPNGAGTDLGAVQRDEAIRQVLAQEGNLPPADHVGSAVLILDPEDNRRGPFSLEIPPPHPKATWRTTLLGQGGDPVAEASMCGTCHTLDNPALSWDPVRQQYWPNAEDTPPPSIARDTLFPIERTFDEWLNSDYATTEGILAPQFAGAQENGIVRTCQDCHMPRTTGLAATTGNPVVRDCKTNGCLPAHVLVGGNTWVPQLLQDSRWRLAALDDAEALNATVLAAREMLKKSATLSVSVAQGAGGKQAIVRIVNESGHKLPTGYAEGRRMWLSLQAYDAGNNLVYASGVYDPATGVLADDPALKVYEVKQGITPELAQVLGKEAGESFHFVLNNTVVKDNRIPPRGYTVAAYNRPGMVPVGTSYADGQFWDEAVYAVPESTVRVVASFYYQTSSKEYIDFLRAKGGADGAALGVLWDTLKSPPELVGEASAAVIAGNQPPTVVDDVLFDVEPNRTIAIDVLKNDTDPEGAELTLVAVGKPNVGRATFVNNQIAYTPVRGYSGEVTMLYTVRDTGANERTGRVTIQVASINYFPAVSKQ